MATIKLTDTSARVGGRTPGPAPSGQAFFAGLDTAARGTAALGQAIDGGLSQFARAQASMQLRTNERRVQEGVLDLGGFASDLLNNPDQGILNRKGKAAEGASTETGERLKERIAEIAEGLDNPVQRQAFLMEGRRLMLRSNEAATRHEAHQLEVVRKSDAVAILENLKDELAVGSRRDELLNPDHVEANREEFEDRLRTAYPEDSDTAIALRADQALAQTAAQAAMSLVDATRDDSSALGRAQKMLERWGDRWDRYDPQLRSAVEAAIQKETGWELMTELSVGIANELGVAGSEYDARRMMDERFPAAYERKTGMKPPETLSKEAQNEAAAVYQDFDRKLSESQSEERAEARVRVYQAFDNPRMTTDDRLQAIRSYKRGLAPGDVQGYEWANKVLANLQKGDTAHAQETSQHALDKVALQGTAEFKRLTRDEVLQLRPEMTTGDYKAFFAAWQDAQNGVVDSAQLPKLGEFNAAIDAYTLATDGTTYSTHSDYQKRERTQKRLELQGFAEDFYRLNNRPPAREEMVDWMRSQEFSLNDPNQWDDGFTGTVRDLLTNPAKLDLSEPLDAFMAKTLTEFALSDTDASQILSEALGTRSSASPSPEQVQAFIASQPEVLSRLLRIGLTSRTRFGQNFAAGRRELLFSEGLEARRSGE